MATQVQFRRGTTTQNNAFTGAIGEITYDTEAKTLRLHDGSTAGGGATVVILAGTQTLTNKTLSTNSVWQGNSVGLAYGGTNASLSAVAGGVVYSGVAALAISAAGTSGQVLTSAGSSAPTWTSQSSLSVGTATVATRATNIDGGSAGNLVYQVDTNQTGFIAPGITGYVLQSTGASTPPAWVTSDLTIGSTAVTLGTTQTSFAGLTALDGTSGSTSYFPTPTSPNLFAGATTLTVGYTGTASSTTNISTGAVGSGNTKTVNIGTGGAAGSITNINLGDGDGGTVTVNKDLVVTGDLTVNGTTTTINSTTLDVDDINITLAKGAANAASANGAGLTIDGSSATILYTSATDSWNFNKPLRATTTDYWLVPAGTVAQRPGTPVNGMVRYNTDQSSFEGYASGAWSSLGGVKSVDGYTYIQAETSAGASNGDLDFYAEAASGTATTQVGQWNRTNLKDYTGTIVGTQTTQNVFNATATTVNAFGAATSLTLGATTGTATIRNSTVAITNDATIGSTLSVTGAATFNGGVNIGSNSLSEYIADTVGAMVTSNTESGISVTYDDTDNTLDFDVGDFTITLTGDVTGTGTVTNLGNVSFATTIAANSVALGTDTTGNYVATVAAGTPGSETSSSGLTISAAAGEGTAATIAHADTSSQTSVDNSNGNVIQDITLDGFGHITAIGSVDLDGRYYTETEADNRFVNVAGDTMTSFLTLHADPTSALHAATKQYVDEVAQGILTKPAVEIATTANLTATYSNGTAGVGATLTATTNGAFPAIDGITLSSTTPGENGILVKNQSSPAQNGRYNLTQVGSAGTPWILTRCGLCDEADEIPGAYVFVKRGTLYAGTGWVQTVANPSTFVVGTDAITVTQFSGAGTYTAGTGLTLSGTQFSVNAAQTQITSVGTLTGGTWNASIINSTYGGTGVNNGGRTITLNTGNLTLTAQSGGSSVTVPSSGTLATLAGSETLTNKTINLSSNTLTATSAQIAAAVTDETGSGSLVFATSPTLVTPNIGAATGTSLTTTGGGVLARAAATQDGIEIRGRAGGTGNWEAILTPTTLTADRTFTFPDVSGTVITTGDTGTVTSTMIADGTIVNGDISASAAIAVSKLAASTISGVTLGNNLNSLTAGSGLSGTAYNGSAAQTWTLANSGVTAGSYGGATAIPVLTIDSFGRVTSASTSSISVGNGTLTLAVSGTGLSGSASFTANQSGNSTFTVTSNATSANTGGAIVARDANGDFTAGTVTAVDGFVATSANPFVYTATTIASNVTIPTNYNAMSAGPITINDGVTVTVPDGSVWTIV